MRDVAARVPPHLIVPCVHREHSFAVGRIGVATRGTRPARRRSASIRGFAALGGLAISLVACSAPAVPIGAPSTSASAVATAPKAVPRRGSGDPEVVVLSRRPSGRYELFPEGRFLTPTEVEGRTLQTPSAPYRVAKVGEQWALYPRTGPAVSISSSGKTNAEGTWLLDNSTVYSIADGARFSPPDAGVYWISGDYVGSYDGLWHLPDMKLVAVPSNKNSVVTWGAGATYAIALSRGPIPATTPPVDGMLMPAEGWAEVWDLAKGGASKAVDLGVAFGLNPHIAVSDRFAGIEWAGKIWLLDMASGKLTMQVDFRSPSSPGEAERIGFSSDNKWLCVDGQNGSSLLAVGGSAAPSGSVALPVFGDGPCRVAIVPKPPAGRSIVSEPGTQPPLYPVVVAESQDGTLWAVRDQDDGVPAGESPNNHVRIIRVSDGTVLADLPYPERQRCDGLTFEENALVAGDARGESCGGRIDLTSLRWRDSFLNLNAEDQKAVDREAENAMVSTLGPPLIGDWGDVECDGAPCVMNLGGYSRTFFENPMSTANMTINHKWVTIEIPAAAMRPGAIHRGIRFSPEQRGLARPTKPVTVALFYDGWMTVNRLSDGKLLATVVQSGRASVALLSGGAVDVRGAIDEEQLSCRVGDVLRPWTECRERFLVDRGLESALAGREDYLQ